MNEFSILCRVIGSLFNRQPQDPLLVPLFTLLREGKLQSQWPLEQDELLTRLQQNSDPQALAAILYTSGSTGRHSGRKTKRSQKCVRF